MQTPLEIAFHNMPSSDALEAEIRRRADKLDRLYDRLTGCRVSIEALHKQHQTGNVYEVHIDLLVPGDELAVSRQPHRVKERYANPDVRTSIRDAFKSAERQLKEFKARQRGEVKPKDFGVAGQVSQIYPAEDHGFILTAGGTQLYFHRNSVLNNGFDKLQRGDAVNYIETVGDTGPIASKVWTGAERPDADADQAEDEDQDEGEDGTGDTGGPVLAHIVPEQVKHVADLAAAAGRARDALLSKVHKIELQDQAAERGSRNPTDLDSLNVLDSVDSPELDALRGFIAGLGVDARQELKAVLLIGRGDFGPNQWDQALLDAGNTPPATDVDYLSEKVSLHDYLVKGLYLLGLADAAQNNNG